MVAVLLIQLNVKPDVPQGSILGPVLFNMHFKNAELIVIHMVSVCIHLLIICSVIFLLIEIGL